jgi:hypothetical protein
MTVQNLHEADCVKRIQFCDWFCRTVSSDENNPLLILQIWLLILILGGCPYIISCVIIYKLQTVFDVSNVTWVTKWMNK